MRTDYEGLAARYDEDRARWSVPRDDIIDDLLRSRAAVRVLDLGCGTGAWLAAQRDHLGDAPVVLLGADPSAAMIGEARAKGVDAIVRARAEDLAFADATIDYLTTSYTFHHFVDKDRVVDEVARVLVPGGIFRMINIEPGAAPAAWWVHRFFPETVAIDGARFWPTERILDALSARAFSVEIHRESSKEEVPVHEVLADAERRVISELALLDDDAYSRGLAHLRAVARTHDTVRTTTARLFVTARRAR